MKERYSEVNHFNTSEITYFFNKAVKNKQKIALWNFCTRPTKRDADILQRRVQIFTVNCNRKLSKRKRYSCTTHYFEAI